MKALVKYEPGPGNVELRDMDEPVCGAGQVKIEVGYCGICGTDLHVFHDTFRNYPPVILGHEFSGTIVETGSGVQRVRAGDPVTVLPASAVTCGRCRHCREGLFLFCPERRGMGHGVNGAFTRYALAREDQVYRLPAGVPLDTAALCEPLAAAAHAVLDMTKLSLGDVVLLSGPGPIGLLCLKLLALHGVKTIVAGGQHDTVRLALARDIGAHATVNVAEEDLLEIVRQQTDGLGADVAIECAGAAASVSNCLDCLRPRGQLTQVGHFGREVPLRYDWVAFRELQIRGSVGYTAATWDRVMRILDRGDLDLSDVISHKMPLDSWSEGFELCERKEGLKVLLSPTAGE